MRPLTPAEQEDEPDEGEKHTIQEIIDSAISNKADKHTIQEIIDSAISNKADKHTIQEIIDSAISNKADKLENGHGIVRSVNNQYADDNGNVNLSGIDIGMIIPFAGNGDIPVGFLLCDGASVLRDTYPDLFSVIGTTYGAVDDTHFNLPDLSDRFIEGAREAGIKKEAGLPNIKGSVQGFRLATEHVDKGSLFATVSTINMGYSNNSNAKQGILSINASKSNKIYGKSNTVQPPSLTVRYIIKAFAGASTSSTDLEITKVAQDLADKANRSLTNTADNVDFVVESYSDENGNWYRKFKSGWLEQGGVLPVLSKAANKVVSLLKPFATKKYTVLTQNYHNGDTINVNSQFGSHSVGRFSVFNFTATSFNVYYGFSSKDGLEQKIWYACGQGAEE